MVVLVLVVVCSGQPWGDRIWGEVERELGSAARPKGKARKGPRESLVGASRKEAPHQEQD